MRVVSIFLLLCNFAFAQEKAQFPDDTKELLESLRQLGTGQLPPGFEEAEDLATTKELRVKAAEEQMEALRARYESGLDNVDFLLTAQIELTLARMDTTDDRKEQLKHIHAGLSSAILLWQRVAELQQVGAHGGSAAALAQAKQQVFKYLVWWHKWKAGQEIGRTLDNPSPVPR